MSEAVAAAPGDRPDLHRKDGCVVWSLDLTRVRVRLDGHGFTKSEAELAGIVRYAAMRLRDTRPLGACGVPAAVAAVNVFLDGTQASPALLDLLLNELRGVFGAGVVPLGILSACDCGLNDAALRCIARFLRGQRVAGPRELHLVANRFTLDATVDLLDSANNLFPAPPMGTAAAATGEGRAGVPLYLRLDRNAFRPADLALRFVGRTCVCDAGAAAASSPPLSAAACRRDFCARNGLVAAGAGTAGGGPVQFHLASEAADDAASGLYDLPASFEAAARVVADPVTFTTGLKFASCFSGDDAAAEEVLSLSGTVARGAVLRIDLSDNRLTVRFAEKLVGFLSFLRDRKGVLVDQLLLQRNKLCADAVAVLTRGFLLPQLVYCKRLTYDAAQWSCGGGGGGVRVRPPILPSCVDLSHNRLEGSAVLDMLAALDAFYARWDVWDSDDRPAAVQTLAAAVPPPPPPPASRPPTLVVRVGWNMLEPDCAAAQAQASCVRVEGASLQKTTVARLLRPVATAAASAQGAAGSPPLLLAMLDAAAVATLMEEGAGAGVDETAFGRLLALPVAYKRELFGHYAKVVLQRTHIRALERQRDTVGRCDGARRFLDTHLPELIRQGIVVVLEKPRCPSGHPLHGSTETEALLAAAVSLQAQVAEAVRGRQPHETVRPVVVTVNTALAADAAACGLHASDPRRFLEAVTPPLFPFEATRHMCGGAAPPAPPASTEQMLALCAQQLQAPSLTAARPARCRVLLSQLHSVKLRQRGGAMAGGAEAVGSRAETGRNSPPLIPTTLMAVQSEGSLMSMAAGAAADAGAAPATTAAAAAVAASAAPLLHTSDLTTAPRPLLAGDGLPPTDSQQPLDGPRFLWDD